MYRRLCSQLSCLSSSVGRASHLECVRRGFESHLSAAFSLEKLSQVLCCVVLCCFALSFFLSFSLFERLSKYDTESDTVK